MKYPFLAAAFVLLTATPCVLAQEDDIEQASLMTGCDWKKATLNFTGPLHGKLNFRYQYCDGTGAAKVGYSLDRDGLLMQQWNSYSDPVARFWPLKKGERRTAAIERLASPSIKPEEKGRCIVHLDMLNGTYSYMPNADYLAELQAGDEPYGACGEFGDSNDSIQYWQVIDNKLLTYLWLGQDTPIIDPKSLRYTAK